MTDDVVDLLRRHDPVAGLDPVAPPELLERVCAEPRRRARPPRFARLGVGSALSVVSVAAALLVVSAGRGGHSSLALAARAYVQTDSAAVILHVIYRESASRPTPLPASPAIVFESWLYRNQARQIIRTLDAAGHPGGFSEQILGADGVLRNYVPSGGVQTISPADGPGQRLLIDSIRTGFVATFRAGYRRGALDDTGTAAFMGRPARRYTVAGPAVGAREDFYLDPATGAPLGSVTTEPFYAGAPSPGALRLGPLPTPAGTTIVTQVVERIERLPATPANLAKLRQP